jgi:hypothetical protein
VGSPTSTSTPEKGGLVHDSKKTKVVNRRSARIRDRKTSEVDKDRKKTNVAKDSKGSKAIKNNKRSKAAHDKKKSKVTHGGRKNQAHVLPQPVTESTEADVTVHSPPSCDSEGNAAVLAYDSDTTEEESIWVP